MKVACVTGGSGYIASALVKMLLEKGYAVKTTVRNPDDTEKNSHLKDLQALGPLTVLRADLDEEGSFDEAVSGCDYVFLVAAPVNLVAEDQKKELIEPAVRGTLNVLRSCAKAGTVKRVIITSSVAGVYIRPDLQGEGHVLDEESWSDVEYLRANKPPTWGYCVSKVLLEKAASRFAEEHGISLVTLCPVITVGAAPARKVRTSIIDCLSLLSGREAGLAVLKGIEKTSGSLQLVHVRDLCRAELFVAEEAAAAGRYVCVSLNTTVLELARFLAQKYPQYKVKTNLLSDDDQLLEKPRVDGWQPMTRRRGRRRTGLQFPARSSSRHQDPLRQAIYLSKVHGKCFNCLAYDHRVAQCRDSIKCWVCQCSDHISYGCRSRRSVICSSQHRTSPSSSSTSPSPSHSLTDAASPELLLGSITPPPMQLPELAEDPMVLEVELTCCHVPLAGIDQDKVVLEDLSSFDVMTVERQDAPSPILVESVKLGDDDIQLSKVVQEPRKDSQTPLINRSEAEQSIGHQLIKALSNLKQNQVAPLSFSNLHTSFGKEICSVGTEGNQNHSRKSKIQIKTQKLVVKVVRDMLIKKWIFIRREKQLDDSTSKPLSISRLKAIKKLSEMAMFMEALRKIKEVTEKRKREY